MNQVRVKLTDPTRIFSFESQRIVEDETMVVPMSAEISTAINSGQITVVEDLGEVSDPELQVASDVDLNDPKLSLKQLKAIAAERNVEIGKANTIAAVRELIIAAEADSAVEPSEDPTSVPVEDSQVIENNDVIIDDKDASDVDLNDSATESE